MRKFGAYLMVIGFFLTVIYPIFQQNFYGHSIESQRIYNKKKPDIWKKPKFKIAVSDNPARLTFRSEVSSISKYQKEGIQLEMKITGPKGVVLEDTVKLVSPKNDIFGRKNMAPVADGPLFVIDKSGTYTVDISMKEKPNRNLSSIYIYLDGRVGVPDTTYLKYGAMAMLLGFYLFVRRRKIKPEADKNGADDEIEVENSTQPSQPEKINWGRDTDSE